MILIDTSVWIDHFRSPDAGVLDLLEQNQALAHPFVLGEIMLGNMRGRTEIASLMKLLPGAAVADSEEVLAFIAANDLGGRGIGYVDAHLLASARLSSALLWTRDKPLAAVADELAVAYPLP